MPLLRGTDCGPRPLMPLRGTDCGPRTPLEPLLRGTDCGPRTPLEPLLRGTDCGPRTPLMPLLRGAPPCEPRTALLPPWEERGGVETDCLEVLELRPLVTCGDDPEEGAVRRTRPDMLAEEVPLTPPVGRGFAPV